MSTDAEIFFKEPVKIQVPNKKNRVVETIEVEELTLKNRGKFLSVVSSILIDLNQKFPNLQEMPLNNVIPAFIDVSEGRLVEIYEIVTGRSREWLEENLTLRREIDLLKAIVEVNDIPFLAGQIRQLIPKIKK
ncbi:MAG: hypothetical protein [Siphoviridae sp. ctCJE6]|nr:MAG: hypothetical protein [Siphoviridae sp. ctCJE6]